MKDADVVYLQSNPTIYIPIWHVKHTFKKTPIVCSIYDVYVVPAWYDVKTTSERPKSENRFIQKYNISTDKFVCQYAGSLGYVFNYKTILELAERLQKKDNDILVEVIGDGPIKDTFVKEAQERGLDNIAFYPLQPVSIVPDVYSACDVEIIPLKKGVIGNGTPSKAPILMACKRLIINSVEAWSKYSKSFKDNDMGLSIDIDDLDGLADAVCWAKNNPQRVKEMTENAYTFVCEHFSSTKSLETLSEMLKKYAVS